MTTSDPYVIDDHTGWTCDTGASLITDAMTPGPGKLGTLHGVIYVCPDHQADAEAQITGAGYNPETSPAPLSHRHNPWPCGHVTAFGPQRGPAFLAALRTPTV